MLIIIMAIADPPPVESATTLARGMNFALRERVIIVVYLFRSGESDPGETAGF